MTLALAQSPLKLLADVHLPAVQVLHAALAASLWRLVLLLPLAWLAVRWSALAAPAQVLAWTALLALLQLGWYLAQPLTLRTASTRSSALARALPPLVALTMAGLVGSLWPQAARTSLLLAALSGYAVGALWLLPGLKMTAMPSVDTSNHASSASTQADNRSATLRLAHTSADALAGVAIVLVWQRSHGAVQAGYLAVLLRVLGFVPTMIHAAWAQVLLAQGNQRQHPSPLWIALAGALATAFLGLVGALALQLQWLAASWNGLLPYVLPLVLWQASACLLAACSHLPFQRGRASAFSYAAIAFDLLQLSVLCAPLLLGYPVAAVSHIWWVAGLCAAGLISLSVLLLRLPRNA
ncbi:hypothetical protein GALL_490370 [mine drainage metagenome]|uniref:Uncharacterized protein n=1 Tax=mine drainage metagenome TaxID=410659 RepID=A0A1J5PP59_9ZZZZ